MSNDCLSRWSSAVFLWQDQDCCDGHPVAPNCQVKTSRFLRIGSFLPFLPESFQPLSLQLFHVQLLPIILARQKTNIIKRKSAVKNNELENKVICLLFSRNFNSTSKSHCSQNKTYS